MKTNKLLLIQLLLICSISLFAQDWVSLDDSKNAQKPSIEIISSTSQEFTFKVKVFGFYNQEISINNTPYDEIYFPDYNTLKEVGKPALPVITELIGIPPQTDFSMTIIDSTWKQLSDFNIAPYQKSLLETEKRTSVDLNKEFYSSSFNYPEKVFEYSELMSWRGIENRNMTVCPFRYNPNKQLLDVMIEFTVKIEFTSKTKGLKSQQRKNFSTSHSRAFNKHILNFDSELVKSYFDGVDIQTIEEDGETIPVLKSTTATTTDYDYLIIASPTYFNSKPLRALKDWKSRIGYKCEMVSTSTTGTTTSDIKDYITDEYTNNGIEYVLFVGDHSDIPMYSWSSCNSDYWYGCVSPGGSTDYQAEVSIGRFSISSLTELENMVNKTINYEKSPPVNDWVEKSLLIAHMENAPGKYQDCKEDIRTATYSITTPTFDRAYGAHAAQGGNDATNQTVINAINDGRGLVNYRGHGSVTGWHSGWCYDYDEFNADEISSLTNTTKTPVIFSIACSNGTINSSSVCLLENFTRGTNGSVAFLGATRASYTIENHTLDKELYNHIYDDGFYNIGDVLVQANIQTMTTHSNNSSSIHNTKIYLWGGDPSLEIWTDTPNQFSSVSISDNGTNVTVSTGGISDCDIIVCSTLDDGDSYFEVAEGVSSHTFNSVARPYYVTVKKHNYIPYLSDTYVQNKTLSSDAFISGNNIYIGSSVTTNEPSGQVTIQNGADILFDAKNDVNLDGLFEAELGGTFEVIK